MQPNPSGFSGRVTFFIASSRFLSFFLYLSSSTPSTFRHHNKRTPERAIDLCERAGFRKITLRGDTDFSQTEFLDGWADKNIGFVFGIDAMPNLVQMANALPAADWKHLERQPAYEVKTRQRTCPASVKEEVVRKKGYKNIRLVSEEVAVFAYQPGACKKTYRVVALRKNLVVEKKGIKQEDEVRHFFYITNQADWSAAEVVYFANDRCNQENLIAQLKSGVGALRLPSNTLESNWAYMVIGALAWSIKAWVALLQPRQVEREKLLRMEFKQFCQKWLLLPCQIVHSARQTIYRIMHLNEWVPAVLETVECLRHLKFAT